MRWLFSGWCSGCRDWPADLRGPRGRRPRRSARHSGQRLAIKAAREGTTPYPDGTIIARLAWSYDPLEESNKAFGRPQSFVAGPPKNGVQFMVKDSTNMPRPAAGGSRNSTTASPPTRRCTTPASPATQIVKARDFVFNRYAPVILSTTAERHEAMTAHTSTAAAQDTAIAPSLSRVRTRPSSTSVDASRRHGGRTRGPSRLPVASRADRAVKGDHYALILRPTVHPERPRLRLRRAEPPGGVHRHVHQPVHRHR